MGLLRAVFGGHGQIAAGAVLFAIAVGSWVYGATLNGQALVRFIFHASMAALVVAAYSIVASALAIRTAERVEKQVDK